MQLISSSFQPLQTTSSLPSLPLPIGTSLLKDNSNHDKKKPVWFNKFEELKMLQLGAINENAAKLHER